MNHILNLTEYVEVVGVGVELMESTPFKFNIVCPDVIFMWQNLS